MHTRCDHPEYPVLHPKETRDALLNMTDIILPWSKAEHFFFQERHWATADRQRPGKLPIRILADSKAPVPEIALNHSMLCSLSTYIVPDKFLNACSSSRWRIIQTQNRTTRELLKYQEEWAQSLSLLPQISVLGLIILYLSSLLWWSLPVV